MTIKLLLFLINKFIYLFFNSICLRASVFGFHSLVNSFELSLEVFSVQVGCVYDKLGGRSSERHIVLSLSKTESVHIQNNIPFPKNGLPLQLWISNPVMKNPKMMSSYFIFIYEQCLFTTTPWKDLAAVVFVSNKFMSIFLRCNLSCYCKSSFPASAGLFRDNKSA